MLRYRPPKSQSHGHRVGRLSSAQILERTQQFLREKTNIDRMSIPELHVGRLIGGSVSVTGAIHSVSRLISAAPKVTSGFWPGGGATRNYNWELKPAEIPLIADWLDATHDRWSEPEFWAICLYGIDFRWIDVSKDCADLEHCTNSLWVHLGASALSSLS